MNERDYSRILCETIVAQRKKHGLTQESLADKLGITFQAVSKWETGQSCPDISLIPQLAEIFEVSIDELFGKTLPVNPDVCHVDTVPWEDDEIIRAVVFNGRKLVMKPAEEVKDFTFRLHGKAKDIISYFPLLCMDVEGEITAKAAVQCANVDGDISAGGSVICKDVSGDVSADGPVTCKNIYGDVHTDGNVLCNLVKGEVCANAVTYRDASAQKPED